MASHGIAWHRMASHGIAWHRMASHRIASHRIASHRIASHRIASHRIASRTPSRNGDEPDATLCSVPSVLCRYTLAKTQQEKLAWKLAEAGGITLQTVCPPFVWGPLLSPHLNFSHAVRAATISNIEPRTTRTRSFLPCQVLLELFSGAYKHIPNERYMHVVDVRDVADVHLLAYETREPSPQPLPIPARSRDGSHAVAGTRRARKGGTGRARTRRT
jgi:hypothetical protein